MTNRVGKKMVFTYVGEYPTKNVYAHVRLQRSNMDDRPINVGMKVVVREDIPEDSADYVFISSLRGKVFVVTDVFRDSSTNMAEEYYVEDVNGNSLMTATGDMKFPFFPYEIRRMHG
jgi:hypothetical protein